MHVSTYWIKVQTFRDPAARDFTVRVKGGASKALARFLTGDDAPLYGEIKRIEVQDSEVPIGAPLLVLEAPCAAAARALRSME